MVAVDEFRPINLVLIKNHWENTILTPVQEEFAFHDRVGINTRRFCDAENGHSRIHAYVAGVVINGACACETLIAVVAIAMGLDSFAPLLVWML